MFLLNLKFVLRLVPKKGEINAQHLPNKNNFLMIYLAFFKC
jgi:hypothetical protein